MHDRNGSAGVTRAGAGAIVAIDLGGTRIKGARVVDAAPDGEPTVVPTPALGPDAVEAAVELAVSLAKEDGCDGVGVCVPGLVDPERGVVVSLPGKLDGIEDIELRALLTERLGVPAIVVNDAIAYGAGEAMGGAGAGAARALVVTIGTGVGVTVFEAGAPVGRGPLGGGILGGFIPIASDSASSDSNGGRGTIEALCAAHRIVEHSARSFASVEDVYAAHAQGDDRARAAIDAYRADLARALVALAHAHAPERIVIGGGPAGADAPIYEGLEDRVNEQLFGSYRVEVVPAKLGDAAALVGLAHLLRAEAA